MSDDVNVQDTSSSDVVANTEAPAPPPAPDAAAPSSSADVTSPSSSDSRTSDREGLLAAVKSVVDAKPETPALPSDDAETEAPGQDPQDKAEPGRDQPAPDAETTPLPDPTEADLKKLRPETRRRFEQLLAQRNEARQQYQAVVPELEQHRQLQGYLRDAQLATEDVNTLLGVGAALRRGDYQAFLDGVTPYVMAAQEVLGLRVSPDLQNQVEQGLIDEATARELTRTRHRAAQAEARLQETNQQVVADQQVRGVQEIRGAVDAWEAGIQRRDPDYARMSGAVRRVAQGLLQERGLPRSPQEAVALTQAAYDEVRAMYAGAQPAPRATRPSPSSIHVATGTSRPEPRTMKEAAVMALANMRRAS